MKKYLIGFIIGAMVMISSNALASVGDTVTAIFAQFEYKVNGVTQTLDSPVLVHDGNSYLRTTQISNMLGYDITYKADSRTIEFSKDEVVQPVIADKVTIITEPDTVTTIEPVTDTVTDTVTPTPSPTPVVDNTVDCKAISDEYSAKIVLSFYEGGSEGQIRMRAHLLEYERDQKLIELGC